MHASAVVHLRAALRDLATRAARDRLPSAPAVPEALKGRMRPSARQ
jgi:hypothetical protein